MKRIEDWNTLLPPKRPRLEIKRDIQTENNVKTESGIKTESGSSIKSENEMHVVFCIDQSGSMRERDVNQNVEDMKPFKTEDVKPFKKGKKIMT